MSHSCRAAPATGRRVGAARLTALAVATALVVGACAERSGDGSRGGAGATTATTTGPSAPSSSATPSPSTPPAPRPVPRLPGGSRKVFDDTFLVAYYGTAQTTALGVLGEGTPEEVMPRLAEAAAAFDRPRWRVQPVFELIATVVDGVPGGDGDYSHDIPHEIVERYIAAAHRHGVLLVLDLQPGRATFPEVARRWGWALKDPWVGLALDPEWRMGPRQVPARQIGSVGAAEVDETSAWLADLTARERLPQKPFVIHQFTTSMVRRVGAVVRRPHLALVQHVDGYGAPKDKLATYRKVARPGRFTMGFKLFYDEDQPLMSAAEVVDRLPAVRFVSFQ